MALIQCHFYSDVLRVGTAMNVILPETASGPVGMKAAGPGGDFPCLTLLHGLSDDHTIWQRRTSIERYVAPLGLAVVMPAVGRSFYADMVRGYRYWTYVSEELPAKARSFFRLSARREDNFVAGLSMGGYGAFKLALNYPERYAAAASLSGVLDLATRVVEPDDERADDYRLIFGDAPRVCGGPNDLRVCAEAVARLPEERRPRLYQCCGTGDFLYANNVGFRDYLRSVGLAVTYEEGAGEHEWGYWDCQIQRVLAWLPLAGLHTKGQARDEETEHHLRSH